MMERRKKAEYDKLCEEKLKQTLDIKKPTTKENVN
jgi:hypothetical protein